MTALGLWGGIGSLGGTIGSVISEALTSVDWRWIFYINIPVAVFARALVPRVLSESRMARAGKRIDVAGAITATGGLVAVVDGLLNASSHPWSSWQVLVPLLGGVALLGIMAVVEARSPEPLIPVRFFTNRTRVTPNILSLALFAAFYGYVFMLTLHMQQVLGYSPLRTGLLYLPLGITIGLGIGLSTALMPHLGVKVMLTLGFVNGALHQVTGQDSGVQTAMQQIGSAQGVSTLVLQTCGQRDLRDPTGPRQRRDQPPARYTGLQGLPGEPQELDCRATDSMS